MARPIDRVEVIHAGMLIGENDSILTQTFAECVICLAYQRSRWRMVERPERCQWVPVLVGASYYYATVAAWRCPDNKVIGVRCSKHQTIDFIATILQTLKVCVHQTVVLWERQRAILGEAELKGLHTSLQLGHRRAVDVHG